MGGIGLDFGAVFGVDEKQGMSEKVSRVDPRRALRAGLHHHATLIPTRSPRSIRAR